MIKLVSIICQILFLAIAAQIFINYFTLDIPSFIFAGFVVIGSRIIGDVFDFYASRTKE